MERHFQRDLEQLKQNVIKMGSIVERNLYDALDALVNVEIQARGVFEHHGAAEGVLENLDPYIQKSGYDLNDYWGGLLESAKYQGSVDANGRDSQGAYNLVTARKSGSERSKRSS